MNSRRDSYRNHIQDRIDHNTSLLFQRFNYFLLVTSVLMVAFVIITISDRFVPCAFNDYSKVALTISIVGIVLSYLFSIFNLMNVRLIYAMGWFLDNDSDFENIHALRRFDHYVSNKFVPLLRFRIEFAWSVYLNTIALIFATVFKFPFVDMNAKKARYMDEAPYTWVGPVLIAYVWLIICLAIFVDSSYSVLWWYPIVGVAVVSLLVGLVKGIRFHLGRRIKEGRHPGS